MSQAGEIDVTGTHPEIPTEIVTDAGTAIPIANVLEVLGTYVAAHDIPVRTTGSGNTVTLETQLASADGASAATKAGLASFDSAAFDVDANGFVQLNGGGVGVTQFTVEAATAPGLTTVTPTASGNVTVNGSVVANHSVVLESRSRSLNTYNLEIQYATTAVSTTANKSGVAHFDSAVFTVDANGFVTLKGGSEAIDSIGVDATSGAGTNPVLPTAAGLITVNGVTVSAGTNPIRTVSTAPNVYQIQSQISQAIVATDATKIGLSAFDSSVFSVDANGFVTLTSGNKDYHDSIYIVGQDLLHGANYTTIASAYAAAVASAVPSTVFIQPGTYTENITLVAGVNIAAHVCDAYTPNVIINGKLSASFSGVCSISGVQLLTNGDYILDHTGASTCSVRLINCYFNVNDNTAINTSNSSGSSLIELYDCKQETSGNNILFTNSGASKVNIYGGIYNRDTGTTSASTISGTGSANFFGCSYFGNPLTTSNSGTLQIGFSSILGAVIVNGNSAACSIADSSIYGGISSCVSIGAGMSLPIKNCTLTTSNTNVITGAGTLIYGGLFFGDSSTINVTTQTPFVSSNDAVKVVAPAGSYTIVPQDAVILVDTSAARTITMPASPATGEKHIIKDATGGAAAFNITVAGNGHNIDGATLLTMSANWQSVTLVYSGSQWLII